MAPLECTFSFCRPGGPAAASIDLRHSGHPRELDPGLLERSGLELQREHYLTYHQRGRPCTERLQATDHSTEEILAWVGKHIAIHIDQAAVPRQSPGHDNVEAQQKAKDQPNAPNAGKVNAEIYFYLGSNKLGDSKNVQLPSNTEVKSLRYAIKPAVVDFVRKCRDETVRNHTTAHSEHGVKAVWYRCAFRTKDFGGDTWISSDCNDIDVVLHVDTLLDLFADPAYTGNIFRVLVNLELEDKYVDTSLKGALDPKKRLTEWEFVRLGHSKDTETNSASDDRSTIKNSDMLIAYRNQYGSTNASFHIFIAPAFEFGDFCIGDCITDDALTYKNVKVKDNDDFNGPQKSFRPLQDMIKEYVAHPPLQKVGSGVPLMPLYFFNYFDPRDSLMITPSKPQFRKYHRDYKFAVRCAHSLDAGDEGITFPTDITIKISAGHNSIARRLREAIVKQLRNGRTGQWQSNSHVLFEEPLADTWEIELWIMPQARGVQKLYKFADPDQDFGEPPLFDFYHLPNVEQGDCRLFVMAHIIAKGVDHLVTGRIYEVSTKSLTGRGSGKGAAKTAQAGNKVVAKGTTTSKPKQNRCEKAKRSARLASGRNETSDVDVEQQSNGDNGEQMEEETHETTAENIEDDDPIDINDIDAIEQSQLMSTFERPRSGQPIMGNHQDDAMEGDDFLDDEEQVVGDDQPEEEEEDVEPQDDEDSDPETLFVPEGGSRRVPGKVNYRLAFRPNESKAKGNNHGKKWVKRVVGDTGHRIALQCRDR